MLFLHSPFSLRSLPFKKSIFEAEQNVSPLEAECVPACRGKGWDEG